jgi:hypothetical protein
MSAGCRALSAAPNRGERRRDLDCLLGCAISMPMINHVAQGQDSDRPAAGIYHGKAVNLVRTHQLMRGLEVVAALA